MAPHSITLAWKIPWTEEPGGVQSMGSRRVGHDWPTSLSLFTFMHWRRKWQPTPVFLPGESPGRGSLMGCIYGVAQSRTRLKWLSSSSAFFQLTHVCPDSRCWSAISGQERIAGGSRIPELVNTDKNEVSRLFFFPLHVKIQMHLSLAEVREWHWEPIWLRTVVRFLKAHC